MKPSATTISDFDASSFPRGGGELGALIRAFDWPQTSLGPISQWSPVLKDALSLVLPASAQIVLFWGPEFVALYNDAYAPTIGNKHPRALGRPARENWSELWDDLEPLLQRARSGETVVAKDRLFQIERKGYLEDVYFDISYSPAQNDTGQVEGVVCIVTETTERVLAERQLRQAHERIELALSAGAAVGTWDWDITNDRVVADERFANVYGVDPAAAAAGAPIARFTQNIHPDDIEHLNADVGRAIETGERFLSEYRVRDSDGKIRHVLARGHAVFDSAGQAVRFPGVVVDITEQRSAEHALRETQERARALFEGLNAGLCVVEMKFGQDNRAFDYLFVQVNSAFEAHTGLRDAAGKWMRDLAPSHEQKWFDIYGNIALTGQSLRFEERAEALGRWYDVYAFRIGAPTARQVAILFNDISERKLAELALRDSEQRFRIVTEAMPGFAWTADPSGALDYMSVQWLNYSGATLKQSLGTNWIDFLHPDDRDSTHAAWSQALATGQPYNAENRLRGRDGTYRWFSARALPLRNDRGVIVRWIGTANDIHDRKDAETILERRLEERTRELMFAEESLRQSHKMEAVGQLTGGIAHDFNNLLTGIIGSLDIIRRRISAGRTDDIDRFMDAATSSANRAAGLTQRLLAFSRRQSLDLRPVDVANLIETMSELLRRTLGEQIELKVVAHAGTWHAHGDPNQIESALLNFAINARDAMPRGGEMTVEARNVSLPMDHALQHGGLEPGDYVVMQVSDTGTGMEKAVLDRVFDPFFTTKPIGQGTGLGLSMAYGYAKQARGHLHIDSEPGAGAVVSLYLPRSRDAADVATDDSAAQAATKSTGETVLVVEDDAAVRLTVVEVLRELGYDALEAVDGKSAIPVLESKQRIDLLISDVGLPGLNGRQVADVARLHRPDLKILFITGYAENAAVRSGFLAPGMEMITKPFALDALAARVREMIEHS